MIEFSEAFSNFLENLNNFDSTYNTLNYSLNNLSIFLKNKVDIIYVKRFDQVDPFYLSTPYFSEGDSNFVIDADNQVSIETVSPASPFDNPQELKQIYLKELIKVDDLQRKLVLYKGRLLSVKYIYLQNSSGSNPNVNDSLTHIQDRCDKWEQMWSKYRSTITYKHEDIPKV